MEDIPADATHIDLEHHDVWVGKQEGGLRAAKAGVNPGGFPAYYVPPFSQKHGNACAQSGMASLLVYWKKLQATATLPYEFVNNGATNPNLLGGLLGTNWERVRDVLGGMYHLNVRGFNNPNNQKIDSQQLINMLASYTSQGIAPMVILGNGELDPGEFGAHWWILCDINPQQVTMVNFGSGPSVYSTDKFLNAWRADGLPWTHHAGVIAWP